jgi:hypothetical protein
VGDSFSFLLVKDLLSDPDIQVVIEAWPSGEPFSVTILGAIALRW